VTPSRRFADRRFAITFFLALISFITCLSYMGLSKFGVETSPDTEILHELLYPPQHSHVGAMLPVPYEQLVPGMYITRQIEGDPSEASNVIASFGQEISQPFTGTVISPAYTTGIANAKKTVADGLLDVLSDQKLAVSAISFKEVPGDAPELRNVLRILDEDIQANTDYLVNGWGAIIITQNQENLKRADLVISWNEVQVNGGKPKLDANGKPIMALDANGNPIVLYKTDHVFIHKDSLYFSH